MIYACIKIRPPYDGCVERLIMSKGAALAAGQRGSAALRMARAELLLTFPSAIRRRAG